MNHLVIIGARGWGREVYWTFTGTPAFSKHECDIKGFLDDNPDAFKDIQGVYPPILSSVENYQPEPDDLFFCALGDPRWRQHYAEIIERKGGRFINIIACEAQVSWNAILGKGVYVGAYSIVSDNVNLGDHSSIANFCTLGHDAHVGSYATLEAYSFMGGYSSLGHHSTMHVRSTILRHKTVGSHCSIGTSSVVMRNFGDGLSLFGAPAQKIKL